MPKSKTPVLSAKGIRKSFNNVPALKDVSLNLYAGEVHGLNGENGAGKSTLIKILTGFYQMDGGEIFLDGKAVNFSKPLQSQEAGISTVYQEMNLLPDRTVIENILLGKEVSKFGLIDKREGYERVKGILERFELPIDPKSKVGDLGLGMQQMVAIVRAVAFKSRVVILDEPTSALNGNETETLFSVIRRLREDGVAILLVSHRMSELYELCDRFTVLRDGLFVLEALPRELPRADLVKAMLGEVNFEEAMVDHSAAEVRRRELEEKQVGFEVRGLTWGERIRDVSFQVRKGEIVGLLGLLGSGRTETFKAIYGAVKADGGEVLVDGAVLKRRTPSRSLAAGLAYLSEDRRAEGIFPGLSVKENMTAAILRGIARFGFVRSRKQREVVANFSDSLRVKAANPEQPIGELSGGNQQKVLLARWLSLGPHVVLLDDPTRGIDIGAKAEVHRVIKELAMKDIAVVVTSSETDELLSLCDRLVALAEGQVCGEVWPSDLEAGDVVQILSGQMTPTSSVFGGGGK